MADGEGEWRANANERAALRRLGWFTAALAVTPYATYKITLRTTCPAAYERYGAAILATESGRATCAGMFAIVAVNLVLLAYVLSTLRGGEERRVLAKKDD
jgi:hypothetical protein